MQIRDIVGRDNLVGGVSADVDAIIKAKLAAKLAETLREAEEDADDGDSGGGVNFGPGCTVTVGGKVYEGDNIG